MKSLALAFALTLAASLAHAATITLSMTVGSGSTAQTITSTPLTTDDTSAMNILNAETATLNAGTPPNPACAPNCTPQQVLTIMAQQFAAQGAAFAQQKMQAAALAAVPTVTVAAPK